VKIVEIKDYTMFHNNKGGTLSNQCLQNAEAKASKSIIEDTWW